ncbi:MAG TPA: VWA domain-containing protein, partial [Pyrinomonadaceae bacterium]
MMRHLRLLSFAVVAQCALAVACAAQSPAGQGHEDRDEIRVLTEEVRIPFTALDAYRRFDPSVELDDLLVREDGVIQQLRSLYRIPASVLLLLDTGGQLPAQSVRLTREAALRLVSGLHAEDSLALMQVGERVELLQDWTKERAGVVKALNNKLFPARRSAFSQGVAAAVKQLDGTPAGNRHLIMITEGVESIYGERAYEAAIKSLIEANVTVHVLSYTSLGRHAPAPRATRQRVDANVPEEILMSLPRYRGPEPVIDMVDQLRRKGGTTIALERLFRRDSVYTAARDRGELELAAVAEETGGGMWLPISAGEMLGHAGEVAREVDARYVLTYRPRRPLAEVGTASDYR